MYPTYIIAHRSPFRTRSILIINHYVDILEYTTTYIIINILWVFKTDAESPFSGFRLFRTTNRLVYKLSRGTTVIPYWLIPETKRLYARWRAFSARSHTKRTCVYAYLLQSNTLINASDMLIPSCGMVTFTSEMVAQNGVVYLNCQEVVDFCYITWNRMQFGNTQTSDPCVHYNIVGLHSCSHPWLLVITG